MRMYKDMVILFFMMFDWASKDNVIHYFIKMGMDPSLKFWGTGSSTFSHNYDKVIIPVNLSSPFQQNIKVDDLIVLIHPFNQTLKGMNSSMLSGMTLSHPSLTLNQAHPYSQGGLGLQEKTFIWLLYHNRVRIYL